MINEETKKKLKWMLIVVGITAFLAVVAFVIWSRQQTGGYSHVMSVFTNERTVDSKTYAVEADAINVRFGFYPHPNPTMQKMGWVCSNLYTNKPGAGHSCYKIDPAESKLIFPKSWKKLK